MRMIKYKAEEVLTHFLVRTSNQTKKYFEHTV